jgi:Fe-S-cluster containining protein
MDQAFVDFQEWIEAIDECMDMISKGCSCKKGCSHCCSQLIFMRRIETDYIISKLKILKINERKKFKNKLTKWHNNFASFLNKNNLYIVKILLNENNLKRYYKIDNKCPFLDRKLNICYIYTHRPIACRIHIVKSNPKYCRPTNTKNEVIRITNKELIKKINTGLDELEAKHGRLNNGKQFLDTFDTIFEWDI